YSVWLYSNIFTFSLWLCIVTLTFHFTKRKFLDDRVKPENKAVLITGCDSGFGHLLAKRLDSKGFHVFATCLFPSAGGAMELKKSCSQRLHVLHLDVTKDDSVKEAAEFVQQNLGLCELWAVVNNAGILKGFSVELSDINDFKKCLDVNTLGPVRVVKAFLPLLRQSKGRIVNITSTAGVCAFPFFTPYITSKYATVGFTDALREEVDLWGIKVISLEPEMFQTGLINTKVVDEEFDETFKNLDAPLKDDYDEKFTKSLAKLKDWFLYFASSHLNAVVDCLESAVCLVYPDHTYKCRRNTFVRFIIFCYELFPKDWQFNFIKLISSIFFSYLRKY
ncbi:estradiol 17-beta-dehydrogenase 2, partial [Trichonephila clavata]